MQKVFTESVEILMKLGFNELESLVYTFLIGNSPATAYRIAQKIGKPAANTYKAVESLRDKGAVIIDETGNKLCRAIAPAELLKRMENDFRRQQIKAERVLSQIHPAEDDGGVYSLVTVEEVFNTLRSMIERAEEIILIDIFPEILEIFKDRLEAAAERGVQVSAQTYTFVKIPGVDCIISNEDTLTLSRWQGQWVCLVVDGAEYLFAYLDKNNNRVYRALWSTNVFLAWIQYSHMANSLFACELENLIRSNLSQKEMLEALQAGKKKLLRPDLRGYKNLFDKFKTGEPE